MKNEGSYLLALIRKQYPIILCFLLPIILFTKLFINGGTLFWGTPVLQYIPWQVAMFNSIKQGVFPWWNSLNGMGAPLIANYQTAFFYPFTWILFVFYVAGGLPILAVGNTVIICLHLILTAIGMVFFTKKLGLSLGAQAMASICFSLSGYIIARINFFPIIWTITWLPWILFGIENLLTEFHISKTIDSKKILKGLLLTFFFVLLLFSGHAQTAWYSFLFAFGWWILRIFKLEDWEKRKNLFYLTSCSLLLAVIIFSVQLVPTTEYLLNTQRATALDYEYAVNYSFWPAKLITLMSPNFFGTPANGSIWGKGAYWEDAIYVGFISIFFAISTLKLIFGNASNEVNKKIVVFLWVVILISFGFAFGKYTPVYKLFFEYIPTFKIFQAPDRMLIWAEISISILAAIGLDELKPLKGWKLYTLRLLTAGFIGIGLTLTVVNFISKDIKPVLLYAGLIGAVLGAISCCLFLLKTKMKHEQTVWAGIIILFLSVDLLTSWIPYIPAVNVNFWNNYKYQMTDNSDTRTFWDSSIENEIKYSTFFPLSNFSSKVDWKELTTTPIANNNILLGISAVNNFDPFVPYRFSQIINFLDEINVAEKETLLQLMNTSKSYLKNNNSGNFENFSSKSVNNYYWFFTCFVESKNFEESVELLKKYLALNPGWENYIVVENIMEDYVNKDCEANLNFSISNEVVLPDYRSFIIDTPKSGFLMLSEIYFPGWNVSVDGIKKPIYYGNSIFKSIIVESGRHLIIFQYRPNSFLFGGIATTTGIIVFLICFITARRNSKKEKNNEKFKHKN